MKGKVRHNAPETAVYNITFVSSPWAARATYPSDYSTYKSRS